MSKPTIIYQKQPKCNRERQMNIEDYKGLIKTATYFKDVINISTIFLSIKREEIFPLISFDIHIIREIDLCP
jgi:hypothetical protein